MSVHSGRYTERMGLAKPLVWLVVLVALLFGLIALSGNVLQIHTVQTITAENTQPLDKNGVRVPPPRPAPTEKDMIANQSPRGFQLLVSYVNSGFEPKEATIHTGDTVRFTNNSSHEMWVASDGSSGPVYPGVQNGCGSSALDTCKTLRPGEYWEFTFTQVGSWSFVNNLDKSASGVLIVVK